MTKARTLNDDQTHLQLPLAVVDVADACADPANNHFVHDKADCARFNWVGLAHYD